MTSNSVASQLKPAKRRPLGQAVADSLRDAIYIGRFHPGQRVGQATVAQELGVSQTTVRDALATLEREGLVERQANQGAAVTQLSEDDVEEIINLRIALETIAVRRLIRQKDPAHLEALADNIRAMTAASGPEHVADRDLGFHELLVRLASHKRVLAYWQTLRTQIKLLMVTHNLRDERFLEKTVENHQELLEILRAGDEEAAVAFLERGNVVHLQGATQE
jgi:DNA-binding GntR family transcriptional regulator